MSYHVTDTEYVEINGVPLATPAWVVNDLAPLWDAPPLRGDDRLIPFSDGEKPLRRRIAPLRVQVPLTIYGDYKWDNSAYSNHRIGLMQNMDHIRTNVLTPSTSDIGEMDLILHMPDGSTRGGWCVVTPPFNPQGIGPGVLRGVLDIKIAAGGLVVLTS